ncbi:MAG TPA: winged helix-turn-helix domain-containing protein [Jatrophihabitans sp.]
MGDTRDIPVTVERSPYTTVLESLLHAARGVPHAAGPAISRALTPATRTAMHALRSSVATRRLPDIATAGGSTIAESVPDHIARLGDLRASDIAESLEDFWDDDMPEAWRHAHESPHQWSRSMQAAATDAWSVTRSRWAGAEGALDREARRIGLAVVTGGMDAVLNSIHPRLRFEDGTLAFRHSYERVHKRGDRRLVLVPMLAGPDQIIVNFELSDVIYIAYPLTDVRPGQESAPDSLALLLGPIRAAAVRLLTRPMTMTQLAKQLHCAPSTATYHCDSLEASGLTVRSRRGQGVWVTRTPRAEMLIDLLSSRAI